VSTYYLAFAHYPYLQLRILSPPMYTFFDSLSGRVFTSPNVTEAPPTTFLPPVEGEEGLLLNLRKLRLMSARYPHLPYALRQPLRTGPLFSCLHYNKLPIVHSNGMFTLFPALLAQWLELDNFLTQVFRALPVNCPPDVVVRPVPSDANYASPFQTENAARDAGMRALKAFQHLITLCSWGISFYMKHDQDTSWVGILLSKGLSPPMVEMLRSSYVGRFHLLDPRVGAVVDVNDEACLPYVRRMVDAQVPVYIYWGTCEQFREQYRRPAFKPVAKSVRDAQWLNANCYPSEALVASAMNTSSGPSTSINIPPAPHPSTSSSDSPSVEQPHVGPTRVAPPPVKGTGQRSGETWKDFFARRSLAHATTVANELPAAKRSREQRVQRASTGRAPGRKGANVFYWEECNGFRIRTPVGYKNYVDMWSDYHGAQRRYDAVADEWDLCSEFEPDARSECSDDDSDDDRPMPSKKSYSSTAVTETQRNIPSSSDTPVDSEPAPNDQQTPRDGAPPGSQISVHEAQPMAEPPSGGQPMPRDPLPESPTSLGSQQPLPSSAPQIEEPVPYPEAAPASGDQPMSCDPLPEAVSASGDEPMLCDPQPESRASLGSQQLPSVNVPPMSHPEAAPSAGDQPMPYDPPSESRASLVNPLPMPEADPPSGHQSMPSNSLPDPQASASAHPASVFMGGDLPEVQTASTMNLQDVLQMWYGLNYSKLSGAAPQTNASVGSLAVKIGEGEATLPGGTSLRMAAIAFLEKLTTAQPLDPAACDLLDGSLVDEYKSGPFTIRRRAGHHIAVDGAKTAKTFYLVTCKATTNPHFVIFLDDPLSVLYLIRAQPGPEPSDVAAELACKGIPFSTRVLRDAVPTAVYTTPLGLGFLPSDYRPHSSDYAAYLQRRENLLRRNYGRAAILKGGIIGRLARESLGDRADFLIAPGPSDDVVRFGSCVKIEEGRYWDDDLDCEDEEIICGVYKLSTGNTFQSLVGAAY
jgi:hypothetical protein